MVAKTSEKDTVIRSKLKKHVPELTQKFIVSKWVRRSQYTNHSPESANIWQVSWHALQAQNEIGQGKKLKEELSWELCCLGRKQEHLPSSFREGKRALQSSSAPIVCPSTTATAMFTSDRTFSPTFPSRTILSSIAMGPKQFHGAWRYP